MTILSVAYPLFPVHADAAGGAEQILSSLDRALTEDGHRSVVIAAQGSSVCGTLLPTSAAVGLISDHTRELAQQEHRSAIRDALRREPVDIVHYHGLDFPAYVSASVTARSVATLHLPLAWYPSSPLQTLAKPVCVSRAQAGDRDCAVISNGVDTERFQPTSQHGDYLLWVGRVCPEKGAHVALRVAHRLGMTLKLAGPVQQFASHIDYFNNEVEPLLDSKRQYVGAIGGAEKVKLLAQAQALLIPSSVPETSSLVAMEALSCGTPVVAFKSGALPEVVAHGRSGFVVTSDIEMADAVLQLAQVTRADCRAEATQRFSYRTMADGYFKLYREMLRFEAASGT